MGHVFRLDYHLRSHYLGPEFLDNKEIMELLEKDQTGRSRGSTSVTGSESFADVYLKGVPRKEEETV